MPSYKDKHLITGTTKLTGLLGSPVSHSISPLMHNEAYRLLGLDYVYLCFDVKDRDLAAAVEGLRICGIHGFNLTMPNKNRITGLVDALSPAAALIGAANTVVREKDGSFTGHNTDGIGYIRALEAEGCLIGGMEVTLLGGGGAAAAIVTQAALDQAGAIHVFLRSSSRFYARMCTLAQKLCGCTPCTVDVHNLEDEKDLAQSISRSSLLINATSVGMADQSHESLIRDPALFRPGLIVSDVIYNPPQTRLLREAAAAGCRTFNGMNMLLYQGAEAFRLWTGRDMPADAIREKYFS